jgi:hypothetical protein
MSRPTRAEWLDAIIAVSREWHGVAPGEGTVYADRVEPLLDRVDAVVDALLANNQAMHDGLVSAIALQAQVDEWAPVVRAAEAQEAASAEDPPRGWYVATDATEAAVRAMRAAREVTP